MSFRCQRTWGGFSSVRITEKRIFHLLKGWLCLRVYCTKIVLSQRLSIEQRLKG